MFKTQIKNLFLIDGLGALLSAFLLGVVLVKLQALFGIPKTTLYFLAILPIFFACFDFYHLFKSETNKVKAIRTIAYLNIAYCILSFAMAIYHYELITSLGWIYIVVEIAIVLCIARIELNAADNY